MASLGRPAHRRFAAPPDVQELLQMGSFSTASDACCACGGGMYGNSTWSDSDDECYDDWSWAEEDGDDCADYNDCYNYYY